LCIAHRRRGARRARAARTDRGHPVRARDRARGRRARRGEADARPAGRRDRRRAVGPRRQGHGDDRPAEAAVTAGARLRAAFDRAAAENRAAFVAYLTFGDPDPQTSIAVVEAACRAGADVIELGVPFSDPSADGPSIQRAMERALAAGASLPSALDAVRELRGCGVTTPIVLFGYYNPIFVMGTQAFAERAAAAGVDAVLTVD